MMRNLNRNKAGLTLIDLLTVMSGMLPAFLICHYFHISFESPVLYLLTFVFGIGFWCIIFLWLLPSRDRRKVQEDNTEPRRSIHKMMEYTKLERGVLDWMAEHLDIPNLADQIRAAVPTKREYTGHGFFTTLSVSQNLPKIDTSSPVNGPVIESSGIEHGGAAILFLDNSGRLKELEMYANGEHFAENITDFELTAWESNKSIERTP